jgi:hypothetical protein
MWPAARSSVPEPEGVPAHVIFTWHKSVEEILDRLAGYCRSLNK